MLAAVLLVGGCAEEPVRHSAAVRLGGPLDLDARRADALGLTPTASLATGPVRINDIARGFDAGRPDQRSAATQPAAAGAPVDRDQAWLEGTVRRYRTEVEDATDRTGDQASFVEPLEDPRLRWVHVEGPVKFYNEEGRRFPEGDNLYLSNRSVARLWSHLVLTVEPEMAFNQDRASSDGSDVTLQLKELAASLRLGPTEFTAGRAPLWWGPGRHGSLLLSNNAQPFDLVEAGTAGPQFLPGILGYLGGLQAKVFATKLSDDDRPVQDPYMAGARLSSRLSPYMEAGVTRTALFGGSGHPVTLSTIGHVITADTENSFNDPGNQLASIDVRVIAPLALQPFEVYGEVGGEDESNNFISKKAFLAGIYLPRLGPLFLFELNVEVADTTVPGNPHTWYVHRSYPYTYRGQVMGHHVGTDGFDVFGELRVHPAERLVGFVSYDYEEHFRLDPVEERLHQFRVGVEGRVWRGLWASGFYGVDWWQNFGQVEGDTQIGQTTGLGLRWEF